MLKTALTNKSIEKGRALEGAEELQVVSMLVKQRRDSIDQFTKGGRRTSPTRNRPRSRSSTPTCRRRRPTTRLPRRSRRPAETGATGAKDMGKVMKAVMAGLAGKTVDGKKVSEAVKAKLAG